MDLKLDSIETKADIFVNFCLPVIVDHHRDLRRYLRYMFIKKTLNQQVLKVNRLARYL